MEIPNNSYAGKSSFTASAHSSRGGGRGRGLGRKEYGQSSRGGGGGRGSSGNDKIDALGRLLASDVLQRSEVLFNGEQSVQRGMATPQCASWKQLRSARRSPFLLKWIRSTRTRILRHMASELKLNMRSDGYVKVQDLLKLNLKTFANIPLRSHTADEVKEAVRRDNKQRFSILEDNGELLIRANQGHTIQIVETESLLKPILSAEEVQVCVHGTYKKNLESILEGGLKRMKRLHVHFSCGLPTDGEVISGMRRDVNVLVFLDVRKALEEGMKLYISDNKVILTEGFDGAVPVKYFKKIESWPKREPIPF